VVFVLFCFLLLFVGKRFISPVHRYFEPFLCWTWTTDSRRAIFFLSDTGQRTVDHGGGGFVGNSNTPNQLHTRMNALRLASRLSSRVAATSYSQVLPRGAGSSLSFVAAPTNTYGRSMSSLSTASSKAPALHELGSVDHAFTDDRVDRIAEPERRAFTYLLLSGVRFAYASTARVLVVKFVSSMSASADVLALASAEFDVSAVSPGKTITVKWRGKPVFIRHRTPSEIATEATVPLSALRDEEADEDRVLQPNWLVVLGICTHLGCVPISGAGDFGGWFCPCHGSHYDVSGRIRKGPAPLNLEVPPYKFTGDAKILIG
jgi:ubiquinol-cytochrome c reductase iron-sulfur subunit